MYFLTCFTFVLAVFVIHSSGASSPPAHHQQRPKQVQPRNPSVNPARPQQPFPNAQSQRSPSPPQQVSNPRSPQFSRRHQPPNLLIQGSHQIKNVLDNTPIYSHVYKTNKTDGMLDSHVYIAPYLSVPPKVSEYMEFLRNSDPNFQSGSYTRRDYLPYFPSNSESNQVGYSDRPLQDENKISRNNRNSPRQLPRELSIDNSINDGLYFPGLHKVGTLIDLLESSLITYLPERGNENAFRSAFGLVRQRSSLPGGYVTSYGTDDCKPMKTVVKFGLISEPDVIYAPSSIEINRCSRGCFSWQFDCIPASKSYVEIEVKVYRKNGENYESENKRYRVESHDQCKCSCKSVASCLNVRSKDTARTIPEKLNFSAKNL